MTEIKQNILSFKDSRDLTKAVCALEKNSLIKNLSEFTGRPIEEMLAKVPKPIKKQIERSVEQLTFKCLDLAIKSLENELETNRNRFDSLYTGIVGGLGGIFGMASLPIELPITTILLLRSIAVIARNQGENLSELESRLACIEVFALSKSIKNDSSSISYYSSRAMLAKLSNDAIRIMSERGIAEISTATMGNMTAQTVTKYSALVSEKMLANAIPVVGAIGGATVNIIFLNYFKKLAEGHFTIRKLERIYGKEEVRLQFDLKLKELKNFNP
jgi:hypothetical protein